MKTHIRHDHELLLQSLLTGKLPRDLPWNGVVELISQIGEVVRQSADEFTFVVGNQRAMFRRPNHDDFEIEETSRLRRFLREATQSGASVEPEAARRMIVAIDHHAAHVYEDLGPNVSEVIETVKPYDPFGFHHHLIHRKEAHYAGDRVPEENSFYEEIATALSAAEEIFILGHAKGKSSAMDYFVEFLKTHHPKLFERITTTEVVDLSALTEQQIEEIAKRHLRG